MAYKQKNEDITGLDDLIYLTSIGKQEITLYF